MRRVKLADLGGISWIRGCHPDTSSPKAPFTKRVYIENIAFKIS